MGQGKDVKNAFGRSGGCTGSEKRYLAKEWGCHHLVTPLWPIGHLGLPCPLAARATNPRSPGGDVCSFLWLLTSNTCPCVVLSPHICLQWLLYQPKSTPTGLSGLGWLSRKWGEGLGPYHSAAISVYLLFHFCLILSTWFAPGSSKYLPLCYKQLYAWDMDTWLYIVKLQ